VSGPAALGDRNIEAVVCIWAKRGLQSRSPKAFRRTVRQLSQHRALGHAEHELLLIGVEELVDQPLLETWRLPPEDTFHRLDQLGDAEFFIGAV
jgi:hypothetical protein